ncbi:hypothetical protein AM571_CH00139 [Rhizobium etli 8C-3]|uniref:Uncharacterized protein n=1 Tax=Rhizobium etli 8C-3 TaxID=538025 RepID=A0A1L5NYS9_RHIET|nr:hypothetical protein AM571_CH00139 [Rhizobium etli 8C-3]
MPCAGISCSSSKTSSLTNGLAKARGHGRNKKSGHCPLFRIRTGRTPGSGAASSSVVSACSGTVEGHFAFSSGHNSKAARAGLLASVSKVST